MNKRKRDIETLSSVDISETPQVGPRFSKRNPERQHKQLHDAVRFRSHPPKYYWNRTVDLAAIGCSVPHLANEYKKLRCGGNALNRAFHNADPNRIQFLLRHGVVPDDIDGPFELLFGGFLNPGWPGDREYLEDLAISIRIMHQFGSRVHFDSQNTMTHGKKLCGNVIQDVICEFVWRFKSIWVLYWSFIFFSRQKLNQ